MALQIDTAVFNLRNWLNGGAHVCIVAVTAQLDTPAAWPYALLAMSGVSFAAWIGNYRRLRRVEDTPLSTIASAAQGYVEIAGRSEAGAALLRSQFTGLPCLWYQFEIYRKSGNDNWVLEKTGTSEDPFTVRDASGSCVIDPRGAEVMTSHEETWTEGDYRYTERLLLAQERIYGLGELVTIGGANSVMDTESDVGALLADWKRDPERLRSRFDLNKDGTLDLQEWELARRQARREVEAQHQIMLAREGINTLRKPHGDRPYLLSNFQPERLRSNYLRWAWGHAVVCICTSGAAAAILGI